MMPWRWKTDYLAGLLVAGIGAFAVLQAQSYRMGNISRVGPGVFPVVVGLLMMLIGVMIVGSAALSPDKAAGVPHQADWRGRGCVLAGPILFILAGHYLGLAPAMFACVFVAALGNRTATLRNSAVLAFFVTVFGIALFSYVLQLQFPIFRWPND